MIQLKTKGFTLIEMIGVMAIIAILASTIAPSIIRDIDRAVSESEQENLAAIAKDLEIYIRDNKRIPSSAEWLNSVASISDYPTDKIQQNERFFNRGYYVDPRFFTSSATPFSTYTQTDGQIAQPTSPRIMLVSNLGANVPAAPNSAAAFNAIWEQSAASILIESDDIKIKRIHLADQFERVILDNPSGNTPGYRLDGHPAESIGSSEIIYVLKNTRVELLNAPITSGNIAKVFIANSNNNSFTYDATGVWK